MWWVGSPEQVSKSLIVALLTPFVTGKFKKFERCIDCIGRSRFISLLSSLNIKVKWPLLFPLFKGALAAQLRNELQRDYNNLDLTIEKYEKVLEAFEGLPTKPVIVIGTVQKRTKHLLTFLSNALDIFDFFSAPLQLTLFNKYVICRCGRYSHELEGAGSFAARAEEIAGLFSNRRQKSPCRLGHLRVFPSSLAT